MTELEPPPVGSVWERNKERRRINRIEGNEVFYIDTDPRRIARGGWAHIARATTLHHWHRWASRAVRVDGEGE